ncbi:ATP-grasp domain-containing protein [Hoyosella rhizosphaerae]|nr:ATP-grasp domain-containing protein [Hoyosella rhizosphaerae]
MHNITSVLVANRGEIARRVFATCRRAGINTVAVFSDADANAPHVAEADAAVRLPGNTPGETYLRSDAIIAAAKAAGADAIHPGYGFLSENADFARAVIDAGLRWIGPPVKAIELMGSKVESKKMMDAAGVPVLKKLDPSSVTEADLPVLIKASAGGGGRGMRVVRNVAELQDQIEGAQREAASAFGDPTVFCERYLETGRHIEVQVMADEHGTVWSVGERECSIQRRHQKVVEEAPSPLVEKLVDTGMRDRLFEAAQLAAKAIDYVGAGTVEFLADESGHFYFLEMNTRLQVEHPVTECTTGLDLVQLQIDVAEGAALPAEQPAMRGHSIEVRLYAEDPAQDWQPQSGTVHHLSVPGTRNEFEVLTEIGVRLDSGVTDGSVVSVFYDPMLAKVISFAPTRRQAAQVLANALTGMKLHGLVTNRDLLVNILRHSAFLAGDTDTAFFNTHGLDTLSQPVTSPEAHAWSAIAAALADAEEERGNAKVQKRIPAGYRNMPSQTQQRDYASATDTIEVKYQQTRSGITVSDHSDFVVVNAQPDSVIADVNGVRRHFSVARYGDMRCVDSPLGHATFTALPRFIDPSTAVAAGSLLAPMPGSVIRVAVEVGDTVTLGQPILWLEAMKMEHTIAAPADGVVTELNVQAGQQVDVGAILAVVGDADAATSEGE